MKNEEPKITFRNLINTIDVTVLSLKKAKNDYVLSPELIKQIMSILNFIRNSKTDSYENALFDKGIFIEKESLKRFHYNLINSDAANSDIETTIEDINNTKTFNDEIINRIQSLLIKISLPIWETTQQIRNNDYA